MITYGSLFSGIGGFDLGFDAAPMRCLWQVEIDAAARSVLGRHWPDVPKYADVRDVGAHNLAPVDVICFGSPCQDLSVAGKRAGMAGERSGLFYEAVRIIRELRPALAIWENVPGALSSNKGRDFGAAIDALAESGALDICWRVLDAQWFGIAQRRRRVFVVADFRAERAGQILFEPEGVPGDTETRGETRQDITPSLAPSLTASVRGVERRAPVPLAMTYGIRAANTSSNGWGIQENASHTLDGASPHSVLSGMAVRRLTPTECERLQGFPDGHTAGQADSSRYRQLGNAVCVAVSRWLGRRIVDAF